jgi:hypothetical protein
VIRKVRLFGELKLGNRMMSYRRSASAGRALIGAGRSSLMRARAPVQEFLAGAGRVIGSIRSTKSFPRMKKPDGCGPPGVFDTQLKTSTPRSKVKVR